MRLENKMFDPGTGPPGAGVWTRAFWLGLFLVLMLSPEA